MSFSGLKVITIVELNQLEIFLKDEEKRFEENIKRLENALKEATPHAENLFPYTEFLSEQYWETTDLFNKFSRYSHITLLFSFFETRLNQICKEYAKDIDTEIELKDCAGRGIYRAKVFIQKVLKKDFFSDNQDWEFIVNISSLRNKIVHDNGYLGDNLSKDVKTLIDKNSSLNIGKGNFLKIEKSFSLECLSSIQRFLLKIINTYEQNNNFRQF